jgi:hypothetical protein
MGRMMRRELKYSTWETGVRARIGPRRMAWSLKAELKAVLSGNH